MNDIESRLKAKGIVLPPAAAPLGAYVPAVRVGPLVFLSGQLPRTGDTLVKGKVGAEVSLETAAAAARAAALNGLSALAAEVGGLDRVQRIVKLTVAVASAPGFTDQPKVANGASDLMVEVFGEAGKHARMAFGAAELPAGACVEVEIIALVEATDDRY